MEKINVNIVTHSPSGLNSIPKYQTELSAGFDLAFRGVTSSEFVINPGETKVVPTRLFMAIPDGYELQIRPRSGTSLKTKLRIANTPGTCDSDYRGEIGIICDNISKPSCPLIVFFRKLVGKKDKNAIVIKDGERIAQGVISPVIQANFILVDKLDETKRGTGGFGSTGK